MIYPNLTFCISDYGGLPVCLSDGLTDYLSVVLIICILGFNRRLRETLS